MDQTGMAGPTTLSRGYLSRLNGFVFPLLLAILRQAESMGKYGPLLQR